MSSIRLLLGACIKFAADSFAQHRTARTLMCGLLSVVLLCSCYAIPAAPAFGTPSTSGEAASVTSESTSGKASEVDEKELTEAQKAIKKMNELTNTLELAYEDLYEVQEEQSQLEEKITKLEAEIGDAESQLQTAQDTLGKWVKEYYLNGQVSYLSVLLHATSFGDFVSRVKFMDIISENQAKAVKSCAAAEKKLNTKRKELTKDQKRLDELEDSAKANASAIEDTLVEQSKYFESLSEEVREAVLGDDGEAYAGVAVLGANGSKSKKGSHPEVAALALKYLGIKYVWGGASPSEGFDCSGLVLYCYKKACGINLIHYARTQYNEGKHIAKSALMPGDLVFFGEDGVKSIHHVGIYLGNDRFIHAPHTGDVVKISTLSSMTNYVGACRP